MNAEEIAKWSVENGWGAQGGHKDGWCTYAYGDCLVLSRMALDYVPEGGCIVEIGSYGGRSLSCLLHVARQKKARVAGVDPFGWYGHLAEPELRKLLCMFPDVWWRFYYATSELGFQVATTVKTNEGNYDQEPASWEGPPFIDHNINFLHIDGDHASADKDCELWLPHLVSGGIVAFHDARTLDMEVWDGGKVYLDADRFTNTWETLSHIKEDGCLLIRRKP